MHMAYLVIQTKFDRFIFVRIKSKQNVLHGVKVKCVYFWETVEFNIIANLNQFDTILTLLEQ